ncbi:MAG: ABC transporter permease [Calditrichaeota bacterium]|nr:ABC transporter permease [Calditrichota bacterium]
MRKIWSIIKREYKEAVFKKSFIIITLLMPVLMIALSVLPTLLMMIETKKQTTIHVMDQTDWLFENFSQSLKDTLKNGIPKFVVSKVSFSENDFESVLAEEKLLIEQEKLAVLLVVPKDIDSVGVVQFYARNVGDFSLTSRIKDTFSKLVSNHRLRESGIQPELINKLIKPVKLKTIKVIKGRKEKEGGFLQEYFSTFIFIFIIYLTIILYATAIMRSIIQEKTSRIVETILSGANSFQFMAGKILGQGAVGFTQYIIWVVFGLTLLFFSGNFLPVSSQYFSFSPIIFFYFVVFFILGYFLFSTIYAAIGAITNSEQEAQSLVTPVVLLLVIPLMLIGFIVKNPDSTVTTVFSLIPFFSPIVMFARINLANPPILEILLSIVLLIITIIGLIWLVAKIFRVGILMYGKRPTLPELVKWIKYH